MGMHFDADFWNRFVIPASMAEPALRHAMVAVGIFAEQREIPHDDKTAIWWVETTGDYSVSASVPVRRRGPDDNALVALSNYNKSISLLTKLVSSSHNTTDVVLLTCILFICVELLRGDDEAAFRHFKGGMTIIMDMASQIESSTHQAMMVERVKTSIQPVFNRLEMLSALFGNNASWPYPVDLSKSIPATFSSVGQARDSMVHLMNLCLRFVQTIQMLEYEPSAIPLSASDEQTALLKHLQLWRSRFSTFQSNHVHKMAPDDSYAANVLEIQRIVAYTWVSTAMNPFQCAHDSHIPVYTAAVVLAEQLSDFASTRNKRAGEANNFLLDVEIVGPIYWVCVKCREPAVRRRAIAVLRNLQRREGMWDSRIAATVADRVVTIEEAGFIAGGLPSEGVRIHGLPFALDRDIGPLSCLVAFQTKPFGVYGEWSVWQEHIPLDTSGTLRGAELSTAGRSHIALGLSTSVGTQPCLH